MDLVKHRFQRPLAVWSAVLVGRPTFWLRDALCSEGRRGCLCVCMTGFESLLSLGQAFARIACEKRFRLY